MPAVILDGNALAKKIKEKLAKEIEELNKNGRIPKLIAVQVGGNPASAVYLKSQAKLAERLGVKYELITLDKNIDEKRLIKKIEDLSINSRVNGIILQLPVPAEINARRVICHIDSLKDVEGMHPLNLGKLVLAEAKIVPCTALAIMELIKLSGVNLYGKEVVVVGHSEIVGKPLSLLLLNEFATTTVCHIGTGERGVLPDHVKMAEILVVAVGKAGLIKGEWIKEGAIVIDVGINKVGDKIVGDIEFEVAKEKASFITPVPGGVGPLTVTMLMRNLVEAVKLQSGEGR